MGLRAGLTIVPSAAFEQIAAGSDLDLTSGERCSIDKAWYDFHAVFGEQDPPLSLIVRGDVLHPQWQHSFEEFAEGNLDFYFAFASPDLVRQVAAALITLRRSVLQAWFDDIEGECYDPDLHYFDGLNAVYQEAAKQGDAIMIVIA